MLAGLSLLTAIGLRRFYSVQAMLPNPAQLCPRSPLTCAAYNTLATGAAVDELHVIFIGAAVCALVAAADRCRRCCDGRAARIRRRRSAVGAA